MDSIIFMINDFGASLGMPTPILGTVVANVISQCASKGCITLVTHLYEFLAEKFSLMNNTYARDSLDQMRKDPNEKRHKTSVAYLLEANASQDPEFKNNLYRFIVEYKNILKNDLNTAFEEGDKEAQNKILIEIGDIEMQMGNWQQALFIYDEVLKSSGSSNRQYKAEAFMRKGYILIHQHKPREAFHHYENSLMILKELGSHRDEAYVLMSMANIYREENLWEKSDRMYEECLGICRDNGDTYGENAIKFNMATGKIMRGDPSAAMKIYQQSLSAISRLGDRTAEGLILLSMGNIYFNCENWEKALDRYLQSLNISRAIMDPSMECLSLMNLGNAYRMIMNWNLSEKCYLESLSINGRLGSQQIAAKINGNMGGMFQDKGELDKALKFYIISKEIFLSIGDTFNEALALIEIGYIKKIKVDIMGAIKSWEEAKKKLPKDSIERREVEEELANATKN